MKRICAFSLAIFILVLSVFSVIPMNVRADDDKTVIPLVGGHFGLTTSEAQSKVSAHKDIYYDDDTRAFAYTPASSYNWTLCNSHGATTSTHLSDKQVVALLCSSNRWEHNRTLICSFLSNNNIFRGFMSGVGSLFTGDSDNGTKFLDILTGNYNYLDSLNYDEDTQTITMSNDNSSVDALREEIKQYYYDSIGLCQWYSSGTVKSVVDSSDFRALFEYEEDYQNAYGFSKSKYCFFSKYYGYALFFDNKFDYMYLSNSEKINVYYDGWRYDFYKILYRDGSDYSSKLVDEDKKGLIVRYDFSPLTNVTVASLYYHNSYPKRMVLSPSFTLNNDGSTREDRTICFYSADGSPLLFFKSYAAYYNFINGDQNAYLSSKIEETGQDISYSIKDMNENLGEKMDELINSINGKKESLSADELQDAIDKGLVDLNKNTEDIKDNSEDIKNNTSSILEKLEEQNNILLQILGVTEYIAYNTQKDDGTDYTVSDLKNVLNTMYNGLGNAILYGKNTVTDSGSSSDIVQKASFNVSGAASNSNVAVAAYSLDDVGADEAVAQDTNNMDVHDGLFGKFPFSVPYQLYEWLQVMEADPVAPVFVYNYGFLLGKKNDPKYDLRIDLSIYQPWADMAKSFQRFAFTLLIAVFIFHKFNGNTKGGNLS